MSVTRFIHISDTHIGPDNPDGSGFLLHGQDAGLHLTELVKVVNQLIADDVPVDFVLHTGDLVSDGDSNSVDAGLASSQKARQLLSGLNAPLFLLAGNHDHAGVLECEFGRLPGSDYFTTPSHRLTQPADARRERLTPRTGWISTGSLTLAVLDARPGLQTGLPIGVAMEGEHDDSADVSDPAAWLPACQLEAVNALLDKATSPVVVCLHYPPLPVDCGWMDAQMLIKNGDALHQCLKKHTDRIACVLYGHLHHHIQSLQDGILYCSVGSVTCGHKAWPAPAQFDVNAQPLIHYNYVTIERGRTHIKQCTTICPA